MQAHETLSNEATITWAQALEVGATLAATDLGYEERAAAYEAVREQRVETLRKALTSTVIEGKLQADARLADAQSEVDGWKGLQSHLGIGVKSTPASFEYNNPFSIVFKYGASNNQYSSPIFKVMDTRVANKINKELRDDWDSYEQWPADRSDPVSIHANGITIHEPNRVKESVRLFYIRGIGMGSLRTLQRVVHKLATADVCLPNN